MHIEMSAKGVAKAIGVFLLLSAVSALALTVVAMGVDAALPGKGYGSSFKGLFRIG